MKQHHDANPDRDPLTAVVDGVSAGQGGAALSARDAVVLRVAHVQLVRVGGARHAAGRGRQVRARETACAETAQSRDHSKQRLEQQCV